MLQAMKCISHHQGIQKYKKYKNIVPVESPMPQIYVWAQSAHMLKNILCVSQTKIQF